MLPYLFHFGHFYLPTFGALAALGLMAGLGLSLRTARMAGVDPERLWSAGLFAVIAAFVSSRGLLVVEHFGSFRAFPVLLLAVPSLTAGGMLLTGVATWVWLWWRRVPALRALDAWGPCGAVVWAFLALGHWAEGSDPGLRGQPVALYACAVALAVAGVSWWWLRRSGRVGETAAVALVGVGVGQFFLTFVREPGIQVGGMDLIEWVGVGMVVGGGLMWVLSEGEAEEG